MVGADYVDLKPEHLIDGILLAICLAVSLLRRQGCDASEGCYWQWKDGSYLNSMGKRFANGTMTSATLLRI